MSLPLGYGGMRSPDRKEIVGSSTSRERGMRTRTPASTGWGFPYTSQSAALETIWRTLGPLWGREPCESLHRTFSGLTRTACSEHRVEHLDPGWSGPDHAFHRLISPDGTHTDSQVGLPHSK